MKKQVLAVVEDLFFAVQIRDAAKRAGVEVTFTAAPEEAVARSAEAALVILDLALRGTDVVALIHRLPGEKILAFVPHVQLELRRAAETAGCARVVARSVLAAKMEEALAALG